MFTNYVAQRGSTYDAKIESRGTPDFDVRSKERWVSTGKIEVSVWVEGDESVKRTAGNTTLCLRRWNFKLDDQRCQRQLWGLKGLKNEQFAASAFQSMTSSLFRLKAGFPHLVWQRLRITLSLLHHFVKLSTVQRSLSEYYLITLMSVQHHRVLKMQWRGLCENIIRLDGLCSLWKEETQDSAVGSCNFKESQSK